MNNLHHILHILFFFIRPFTLSHTCTPPYIINLLSVHLLSHEGMIKKKKWNYVHWRNEKMRLKNNWNDTWIILQKIKICSTHIIIKQIIITRLRKIKKKKLTLFHRKKNAITINKKYHKSSYKYEATVYKI